RPDDVGGHRFAVSLLSAAESNVAPVEKPAFIVADARDKKETAAPTKDGQEAGRLRVRREVWPWLAALALAVLAAEWFVYHRRVG
ncbi:MAG TPA: hypothetical protein VM490_02335, partial [Armatimonadaceae bacterium]|nr:hypothetical protein [Armatimonadaceae bacterium]